MSAIFETWKLTKLCMKMLNLKDFEGRVCCAAGRHDPPKGGWDTGVGRLAPAYRTVWSLFGSPVQASLACKKGQSIIAPVSCTAWSIFKLQKWHTPLRNLWSKGTQVAGMFWCRYIWSPIYHRIIVMAPENDSFCYQSVASVSLQGTLTEGEGSVPLTSSLR